MAHRLALAMGETDVDALLASMSAKQLMGWVNYFSLENSGLNEGGKPGSFNRKKTPKEIECILRTKYGKND